VKRVLFLGVFLFLAAITSHAQNQVSLVWEYDRPAGLGPLGILGPNGSTPLVGGSASNGGVGYVLQLGYYTGATDGNLFGNGTWNAVFGPGTSNSLFTTAGMGDNTDATGTNDEFFLSGTIADATPSTEVGIPAANQIMSMRFYNATSLGAATYYGVATNDNWLWVAPTDPSNPNDDMEFNLNDSGTEFDVNSVFQSGVPETNISVVPEPAALPLMGGAMAIGAMVLRRRKIRRV